jgi:hypothetical protein
MKESDAEVKSQHPLPSSSLYNGGWWSHVMTNEILGGAAGRNVTARTGLIWVLCAYFPVV